MGLNKNAKVVFLRIADGKIRQKTDENNPKAEERYDDINGKYMYELVYDSCEGYVRDIKTQTHEKYGTSYNIILLDPSDGTRYSLQLSEESRYFQSMAMLLPNVDFKIPLLIKPFSFKNENNANIGLSMEQNGVKVENFFKDWDAENEVSTPKNGLEDFDFKEVKGDKEETKILQMKLRKFLKANLKGQIKRMLEVVEELPDEDLAQITKDAPEETEKEVEETSKKKSEKDSKAKTETKPVQDKKSISKTDNKKQPQKGKKKDLPY